MPDMDAFIPSGASLEQATRFASGVLIRSIASATEGATSSDIDRLSTSLATGEPALHPIGEAVPTGALGPMELLGMAGLVQGDIDDDIEPYSFGPSTADPTDAGAYLITGDPEALTGGLGDLFKRRKERKDERKGASLQPSVSGPSLHQPVTISQSPGASKPGSSRTPVLDKIIKAVSAPIVAQASVSGSGAPPVAVTLTQATPANPTPVTLGNFSPASSVGTILTSGSSEAMKANVALLRSLVESQMRSLKDSADALSTAKRQYARLAVAAEVLSSPDPVADAMLLFPLSFANVDALEDSMLPYVQHGASTSLKNWFDNMRANLAGRFGSQPTATPLLPMSPTEIAALRGDAAIAPEVMDAIDESDPVTRLMMDEDAIDALTSGDPADQLQALYDHAENIHIQDDGTAIIGDLDDEDATSFGDPFAPPPDEPLTGGLIESIQNTIVSGVTGGIDFIKDTYNKVDPRTRAWLTPVAAGAGGLFLASKFLPKTMFLGGFGGGGSQASAAGATLPAEMVQGINLNPAAYSISGGVIPGEKSFSVPLNELDPSSAPGLISASVPADWPLRMMQLGEQFFERQKYAPWATFSPTVLAGDVDVEVPIAPPFYLRADGTLTGDVSPYLPSLLVGGGKFWDVIKKVGKAVGGIATSPIGKALIGIIPGGGAISAGLDVAKGLLSKAGVDPTSALNALGNRPSSVAPSTPLPGPAAVVPTTTGVTSAGVDTPSAPQISSSNPELTAKLMAAAFTPMGVMGSTLANMAIKKQLLAQKRANLSAPSEADAALLGDPEYDRKLNSYYTSSALIGPNDALFFSDPDFSSAAATLDRLAAINKTPLQVGFIGLALRAVPLLFKAGKWLAGKIGGRASIAAAGSLVQKGAALGKAGSLIGRIWGPIAKFMGQKGLIQSFLKNGIAIGSLVWIASKYKKWRDKKKNEKQILDDLGPEGKARFEELLSKLDNGTITDEEKVELSAFTTRVANHTDIAKGSEFTTAGKEGAPEVDDPEAEKVSEALEEGKPLSNAPSESASSPADITATTATADASVTPPTPDAEGNINDVSEATIAKIMPYLIGIGGAGVGMMLMKLLARRKSGVQNFVIPVRFTGEPGELPVWVHSSRIDPFRKLVHSDSGDRSFAFADIPGPRGTGDLSL